MNNAISPSSRIWFFTSSRFLLEQEEGEVLERMTVFLQDWKSHGSNMQAITGMSSRRILWVALDEEVAKASGCGIDSLTRQVKHIGESLALDFFDRQAVVYRRPSSEPESLKLHEFWAHCKAGNIGDEVLVADTTLKTWGEFEACFFRPWKQTWHGEMWNS